MENRKRNSRGYSMNEKEEFAKLLIHLNDDPTSEITNCFTMRERKILIDIANGMLHKWEMHSSCNKPRLNRKISRINKANNNYIIKQWTIEKKILDLSNDETKNMRTKKYQRKN